jgi:4-hydroxybutyrate dehydrogenase
MSLSIWSYPTRILFGAGSASACGREAKPFIPDRALLVTDAGVIAAGLTRAIEASLAQEGISVQMFSALSTNPTEAEVEAGAEAYRSSRAQGVVAVGGGAPMDVAKLIVLRSKVSHSFEELDDAKGGDRLIPSALPAVLTVPTTAGTGSEIGRAAVLTVKSTGSKTVVFSPAMLPRVAILDPELTVSLPKGPTAATGFDALTHCLEAYLSKGDHPLADSIALGGLELVARCLPEVIRNGSNLDARGGMLKAAMMGAAAFQKGLGACHSLSHPLSAELGLHHGLANALCLPAVIDFNEQAVPERVRRIGAIFGAPPEPGACARRIRELREQVGIRGGLAQAGVQPGHIARLATLALQDGCHPSNPRPCTEEDFRAMYRASL